MISYRKQLSIDKTLMIFCVYFECTQLQTVVLCCCSSSLYEKVLWGWNWEIRVVNLKGCFSKFMRLQDGDSNKEQVRRLCHFNAAVRCVEHISLLVAAVCFRRRWLLFMQKRLQRGPHKGEQLTPLSMVMAPPLCVRAHADNSKL